MALRDTQLSLSKMGVVLCRGLQFGLAVLAFCVIPVGCTDGRSPKDVQQLPVNINPQLPPQNLVSVAQVQFRDKGTQILTMVQKYGSLFLTGYPFGFARWAINGNPERPSLTFAAADQIDTFAPNGKWVVDWYASGALDVQGPLALLSGTAGVSAINIGNTALPTEVGRYPSIPAGSNDVPRDEAFIYKALVYNPNGSMAYGFREQDFVYTLSVKGANLNLIKKASYSADGTAVCCVKGATVFNNRLYVAFTSSLWSYQMSADGGLTYPNQYVGLQAVNVASTADYLYVQHDSSYGTPSGASYPSGIYVYNKQLQNVAYLRVTPTLFAVSPSNLQLYGKMDETALTIFRMQWLNQQNR